MKVVTGIAGNSSMMIVKRDDLAQYRNVSRRVGQQMVKSRVNTVAVDGANSLRLNAWLRKQTSCLVGNFLFRFTGSRQSNTSSPEFAKIPDQARATAFRHVLKQDDVLVVRAAPQLHQMFPIVIINDCRDSGTVFGQSAGVGQCKWHNKFCRDLTESTVD